MTKRDLRSLVIGVAGALIATALIWIVIQITSDIIIHKLLDGYTKAEYNAVVSQNDILSSKLNTFIAPDSQGRKILSKLRKYQQKIQDNCPESLQSPEKCPQQCSQLLQCVGHARETAAPTQIGAVFKSFEDLLDK